MPHFPEWVIFTYLDGNNELEPETAAAMDEITSMPIRNDIILLIQIGRLQQNAVKIIRPEISAAHSKNAWSGVRRYSVSKSGTILLKEFENLNMADPRNLYDYLLWGMKTFQAAHYILVLSGHSCEYIGMLNDYSQDQPYLMGIPELSLVLEYINKTNGKSIDTLLLDTCYFNNIELLYELAQGGPAVHTVLMHRGSAPAAGLSYRELFNALDKCCPASDSEESLRELVQYSSADLIAYRIDAANLELIKKMFGRLAREFLRQKEMNFLPVIQDSNPNFPAQGIKNEITERISSLIIEQKINVRQPLETICALDKYIPDKDTAKLYYRLAFARENYWTQLLCSRLPEDHFKFVVSISLSPMVMGKSKVKALIRSCNPTMSENQINDVLDSLATEQGWDFRK